VCDWCGRGRKSKHAERKCEKYADPQEEIYFFHNAKIPHSKAEVGKARLKFLVARNLLLGNVG